MTINVAAGAAAYANAARQLGGTGSAATPVKGTGEGFGEMLQKSLQSALDTQRQGEAASLNAITGKADINSVVEAVNNAELTLQTVLAVRDKVLSAYTEIMHMTV
jgi:flagellar hook-basal body complex protein FliE